MFRVCRFCALMLIASIALTPDLASARAGASSSSRGSGYSSMGTRGSQTYTPNGAAPITRSMTPTPGMATPGMATPGMGTSQPGYPGTMGYPSFFQRHPFMSGIMGGLAGSWLGNMLFGHGGYGGGFGSILPLLLMFGLGWWLWRMFSRGSGGGMGSGRIVGQATPFAGGYRQPQIQTRPLQVADQDLEMFARTLGEVQAGWSEGNLDRLRRVVTPEMLSYFADLLADNQSRGVSNQVRDVVLSQGDLRESWSEGGVDYATAYLRWSAIDYTVLLDGRPGDRTTLVEGDPNRPVESAEVWTFRRAGGGHWLLSAIQQTS